MRGSAVPLYIAPYAISNPFQFTVTRSHISLAGRITTFIRDLAAEEPPPSKAFVDKMLVPHPDSWVLLDLGRGTLIHSFFATPYLSESVRLTPKNPSIVLPTIATLITPQSETVGEDVSSRTINSLYTMLHTVLPSLPDTPRGIWKAYLEKSKASPHDKYEPWNLDSIDIKGENYGLKEGSVHRLEGTLPPPPQCPKDQNRLFQEGLRYQFFGGDPATQCYHLCLWIPGASFPYDVFVPSNTNPYEEISVLLNSVLSEWKAEEGKLPLVAELGYYPIKDSWMLVDFYTSPFTFVHTTDIKYMSFLVGESMAYIVLPTRHGELVPAIKEALASDGSVGWKKYWQDKLSSK